MRTLRSGILRDYLQARKVIQGFWEEAGRRVRWGQPQDDGGSQSEAEKGGGASSPGLQAPPEAGKNGEGTLQEPAAGRHGWPLTHQGPAWTSGLRAIGGHSRCPSSMKCVGICRSNRKPMHCESRIISKQRFTETSKDRAEAPPGKGRAGTSDFI